MLASDIITLKGSPYKVPDADTASQMAAVCQQHEITAATSLPSVLSITSNHRNAIFDHITKLHAETPAHKILQSTQTTSTWHLANHPVVNRNVLLASSTAAESTRSKKTTVTCHLQFLEECHRP